MHSFNLIKNTAFAIKANITGILENAELNKVQIMEEVFASIIMVASILDTGRMVSCQLATTFTSTVMVDYLN